MAQAPSPLRLIAREMLADGAWRRFLDVQVALMPYIEPGMAIRQCEKTRRWKAERTGGSIERVREKSAEDRIHAGRITIARKILSYRRDFEIRVTEDGEKHIRLRPDVPVPDVLSDVLRDVVPDIPALDVPASDVPMDV